MATQLAPADEPGGMSDNELAAILSAHETRSVGYFDSQIADEQARAINYYYGIMDDLPPADGCSSVVDHTVAVMVDNGLAAILKPFVSADEVVSFEPRGEEDVEMAAQATEYVNYVINCDNPGFLILHDWFKDALLTKVGIVKAWWEDTSKVVVKPSIIDALEVERAREDPGYMAENDNGDGTFTIDQSYEDQDGRIRVVNVPPEEFLISPYVRTIEEAHYCAHRPSNMTRSDILEMSSSYDTPEDWAKIVDDLPAFAHGKGDEVRSTARYRDEQWMQGTTDSIGADKSQDIIGLLDEYVRVDYDGDGVAELRRVIRVSNTILLNEKVDDNPFAILCPVPMPHKVYGRSVADQSMEGQKVSTAILRQTLDNLYKTNNPRPIVGQRALAPGTSTMDALLDSSPGAAIPAADITQLDWMVVPFAADKSFGMLEAIAQNVEEQTGIQRKGNGLNAEALKKNSPDTATQAAIDENSRNERAEMIARIFAETGVKRLFKLILKLLVAHQPKARIIRLRNKYVEMDPSGWNSEMDVNISVGLGIGNKAEQIQQAQMVVETMAEVAQSPFAHLIDSEKAYNALKRLFTAAGIKNVNDFVVEPQKGPDGKVIEPEKGPDPEMAKAQAQMQIEAAKLQAKAQADQASHQAEMVKMQARHELEQNTAMAKIQLEQVKAQAEAELAQQKAAFEAELATQKANFEAMMAQKEFALEASLGAAKIESDHELKKNRPGGKLDE